MTPHILNRKKPGKYTNMAGAIFSPFDDTKTNERLYGRKDPGPATRLSANIFEGMARVTEGAGNAAYNGSAHAYNAGRFVGGHTMNAGKGFNSWAQQAGNNSRLYTRGAGSMMKAG